MLKLSYTEIERRYPHLAGDKPGLTDVDEVLTYGRAALAAAYDDLILRMSPRDTPFMADLTIPRNQLDEWRRGPDRQLVGVGNWSE